MIKINQLYIRVKTEEEIFEFRDTFSKGLNVITSYSNTKGKSTIGESILFCLGLEEILGYKNERALKPVLRSLIEKNGIEKEVIQSDLFLEIENSSGEAITIQRSPKHSSRKVKLISVFKTRLDEVMSKECTFTDYYIHDGGAAKNIRGFHAFLQGFIGYNTPIVSTCDGASVLLYIQMLASCFYIEQKKGWMNILATMPNYYKIKDSKKRVLEFVLGLSVLDTEREYNLARTKLKETETQWKLLVQNIVSRVCTRTGFVIEGLSKNPYIISEDENPVLYIKDKNNRIEIRKAIEEIEDKIKALNNITEPTIENRSGALNREMSELGQLLERFNLKQIETRREYTLEKEQLESIKSRINTVNKDLEENKDLRKLLQLGSLEKTSIAQSKCPTCGQNIDDTLFEQSDELQIMTINDSIKHLENEKSMLEFSFSAQSDRVANKKELLAKIEERIKDITNRVRIVKTDLVSNNKAISQSHVQKIVDLEIEKKGIKELEHDVFQLWCQLRRIGNQWDIDKAELDKLPSDFMTPRDRDILNKLNKEFKRLLEVFSFESTTIDKISIEDYNYLPSVDGFDLQADSSASDTIRIIWAYIIALHKVSREYGNHLGFLVLDEPAQQNADISSAIELLKELLELSQEQQVFVFYKLEYNDGLLDELPDGSFKRIHADKHLIACVDSKGECK